VDCGVPQHVSDISRFSLGQPVANNHAFNYIRDDGAKWSIFDAYGDDRSGTMATQRSV
jgi:hypothetical protein